MHLHWLIPGMVYSIGSSAVWIFTSGEATSRRAEKSVIDLPEPVGPQLCKIIP